MVARGERRTRVGVVGGGPCATTLSTFLADKGVDVAMFTDGKRPDLVVGESLIPALIPIFRRLGIEGEVAAIGQHKPGVGFHFSAQDDFQLSFNAVRGVLPTYAYNVPRPAFDQVLERRAARSGVRRVPARARLRRGGGNDGGREVCLDEETLALVPEWHNEQPDLIVDASGRARVVAHLLNIPARVGPRKDVAYFAHYENFETEGPPGQTLISRLQKSGWCWRIPLPGRVSVGVVMNKDVAKMLGNTPRERLEAAIDQDPHLSQKGRNRRRLTEVPTYTNYQLISERGFGPGWVAAGDACGFVDPMLSPGLFIAMWSGEMLADLIPQRAPLSMDEALERYAARLHRLIDSWQWFVNTFYDGTTLSIYKAGTAYRRRRNNWFTARVDRHIEKNISGLACGALTGRAYSQGLVRFLIQFGLRGIDPEELRIA